jgi:hypothetical protein
MIHAVPEVTPDLEPSNARSSPPIDTVIVVDMSLDAPIEIDIDDSVSNHNEGPVNERSTRAWEHDTRPSIRHPTDESTLCGVRGRKGKMVLMMAFVLFYIIAWWALTKFFSIESLQAYMGICILLLLFAVVGVSTFMFVQYNTRQPPSRGLSITTRPHDKQQLVKRAIDRCVEIQSSSVESLDDACAVCLCSFEPSDKLLALPCNDSHCFHRHCIQQWFDTMSQRSLVLVCPLCKAEL